MLNLLKLVLTCLPIILWKFLLSLKQEFIKAIPVIFITLDARRTPLLTPAEEKLARLKKKLERWHTRQLELMAKDVSATAITQLVQAERVISQINAEIDELCNSGVRIRDL